MERSFAEEVKKLSLGKGEMFHGEGILAVTKALLQSGVSYVGGYQGAPVSHLIDVLGDARELLDELGIYFENSASEAGAAAMLGASINYPIRGACTWKSTVGTNVASDALANLASTGVVGGALVILGEDYGEGSSIIQERTHSFAMKSQMWLLDPRPNLPSIVHAVEKGFELSEASNTPVLLQLRIRACHVHGSFTARDNQRPAFSMANPLPKARFDPMSINLPPFTYAQEKHKIEKRWPAALDFIRQQKLNEHFEGEGGEFGIVVVGGMYNGLIGALQQLGLADSFGKTALPIFVLNVVYPLVPDELENFCRGKRAVLMVEEGQPNHIEEALNAILRRASLDCAVHGKGHFPMAGEYTGEVILKGVASFLATLQPNGMEAAGVRTRAEELGAAKASAAQQLGAPVPVRPPGFCVGCPERPVFSALKMTQRRFGPIHISADIGCHTFGALAPFQVGNTVLGYGLGLASSSGIGHLMDRRVISIMGDGGFWHGGLTSGVVNAVYNQHDSVLVIMKNGYTSATGTQVIPSSPSQPVKPMALDMEATLKGVGVKWIRTVPSYKVGRMLETLSEAMTTSTPGLKVVIADGECQLERQRRVRPQIARALAAKQRVVTTRFGIDSDVCTGDHSCIRISGCPSLTIKPNPSALRTDPVATVNHNCVGCGLCGENAQAATLCPSFYKAEIVRNAGWFERGLYRLRAAVIGWLAGDARAAA